MKAEIQQKNEKGITLIALVITIALNCYRSGRLSLYSTKYKKLRLVKA